MLNGALFSCDKCWSSFDTKTGLGVHKGRWCRTDEYQGGNVNHNREFPVLQNDQEIGNDDNDSPNYADDAIETSHTDTPMTEAPMHEYLDFQRQFVTDLYGHNAFDAPNIEDFVESVRSNPDNSDSFRNSCLSLFSFAKEAQLSRSMSNKLLSIIREFKPAVKVPKGWRSVKKYVDTHLKSLSEFKTKEFPYPDHWKMSEWKESGHSPSPLTFRARDPLRCVAELFMNPQIMSGWRSHVRLDAYQTFIPGTTERTFGDMMTSVWAENTQTSIRATKCAHGKLLPIAIYCDGVAISHDSLKSVLGTSLNFSDELANKIFAKFSCGNMPQLGDVVLETSLRSHLMNVVKLNATAASREIKAFNLSVTNEFWKFCLSPIKSGYESGVLLRIIGDPNVYTFFPCICFSIGDDPGQKEVVGCYNAPHINMPCTKCTYSPKFGVLYDPTVHPFRDAEESKRLCIEASELLKRGITSEKNPILVSVKNLSLHAIPNAFNDLPMGDDNSIFNSPPDLLHTYPAGMMKSITIWTMTIIDCISKCGNKDFANAKGKFDQRLKDYPSTPELPHVPKDVRFRNGLSQLATNKTSKQQQQATGAGGGFRSGHFINALFNTMFCIGWAGDVLPNSDFIYSSTGKGVAAVQIGNPTAKVMNAIFAVLDVYFQCRKKSFSTAQSLQLDQNTRTLDIHFKVLWELKQAVLLTAGGATHDTVLLTRKNHNQLHFGDFIRRFGAINKADTSTYEAAHPHFTTSCWKRTTHHKGSMNSEMLNLIYMKVLQQHFRYVAGIMDDGLPFLHEGAPFISCDTDLDVDDSVNGSCGSSVCSDDDMDVVTTWKTKGSKAYSLSIDVVSNIFKVESGITDNALKHRNLSAKRLSELFWEYGQSDTWDGILDGTLKIRLVDGISYKANADSGIRDGHIYASSSFGIRRLPRYDFVSVSLKQENGAISSELAQVLALAEVKGMGSGKLWFVAAVQYLRPDPTPTKKNCARLPFKKYEWDTAKTRIYHFNTQLVDFATLSPAYVIPDFSTTVVPERPSVSDKFYHVPLSFTDQGGWDVELSKQLKENDLWMATMAAEKAYIEANQTSNCGLYVSPAASSSKKRAVDRIVGGKRSRNEDNALVRGEGENANGEFEEEMGEYVEDWDCC